jgi:hypothetical protein
MFHHEVDIPIDFGIAMGAMCIVECPFFEIFIEFIKIFFFKFFEKWLYYNKIILFPIMIILSSRIYKHVSSRVGYTN